MKKPRLPNRNKVRHFVTGVWNRGDILVHRATDLEKLQIAYRSPEILAHRDSFTKFAPPAIGITIVIR
ncbi:MAG: hypothetical protein DCC55_02575 [Chloroflexi bacterium]|nr:MAG: hypothetical protein DCC55_02575 [Chloroflexota bacterium]